MRKRFYVLLGVLLLSFGTFGQTTFEPKTNYVTAPVAPQAYQFQKFGDVPIDTKSGLAQINVPLHSINLKEISWNIGLRYNTRGFRISEMASSVGLGWTLDGMGVITAQVIGASDLETPYDDNPDVVRRELDLGTITNPNPSICTYSNNVDMAEAEAATQGNGLLRNYMPDIYNLSLPGLSARFFIHNDIGYTIPASDMKISLQRTYSNGQLDKGYITIIDAAGTRYSFSTKGYSRAFTSCASGRGYISIQKNHVFYLDEVVTIKQDKLEFLYHEQTYTYTSAPSVNYNENISSDPACSSFQPTQYNQVCSTSYEVKEAFLDQIVASNGESVEFWSSARSDISGAHKLDGVAVVSGGNEKQTLLHTSYFGTSGDNNLRLRLDAVEPVSAISSESAGKYVFQYNTSSVLPPVNSLNSDGFGFSNGSDNTGYIPKTYDRTPNLEYAKSCILERIVYPTGGATIFNYGLNEFFGGLVIKRVEDQTPNSEPIVRTYEYPKRAEPWMFPLALLYQGDYNGTFCQYTRHISSVAKDNPYESETVYFPKVTEFFGDQAEGGKVEYQYASLDNYAINFISLQPQLTTKKIYKRLGNNYEKIREEEFTFESTIDANIYDPFAEGDIQKKEKRVWGVIFTKLRQETYLNFTCFPTQFTQLHFMLSSFPVYLKSKKTTDYVSTASGSSSIIQEENYMYESLKHHQPTRIIRTNSKGESVSVYSLYAPDYQGGSLFTDELNSRNMVGFPIETVTSLKNSEDVERVLSANVSEFDEDGILNKVYVLPLSEPLSITQFKFSNSTTGVKPFASSAQAFNMDSRYKMEMEVLKAENGNISEVRRSGNNYTSSLFNPNIEKVVAVAQNATHTDIAYTSFEDIFYKGGFVYSGTPAADVTAFSGRLVYDVTDQITKTGLNSSQTYLVSYWSKSGSKSVNGTTGIAKQVLGTWTLYEHRIINPVSGQITVSGSGVVDEVRLYPVNARMSTYVHERLFGVSMITDAGSMITRYDYDGFGRLFTIRDESRNILKQFNYQYTATKSGLPAWQATGQTRCKVCTINPAYLTGIREIQVTDVNPLSTTYGTTIWQDGNIDYTCEAGIWENTTEPIRCKKTFDNQNTGEQEQQQRDVNPCSPTYDQIRWVVVGTNLSACPLPATCIGCDNEGYKCIDGDCVAGVKVYTDCIFHAELNGWVRVYHYEFPDGSSSQEYYQRVRSCQ